MIVHCNRSLACHTTNIETGYCHNNVIPLNTATVISDFNAVDVRIEKNMFNQRQHSIMASSLVPFSKSANPQTVNKVKSSPTSFASLSRELRDQIYRHIVVAEDEPVAITSRATDYGNGEGIKAIRAILHSSNSRYSTARFAREAYEVYFRENIFQVRCDSLDEFLTRKSLYLKNEGFFSIGAWVGRLDVIIPICAYPHVNRSTDKRVKLVNELRQLLGCPRLHTVSLRIEHVDIKGFELSNRKWLYDISNAIADICSQLHGKMGSSFKVEAAWEGMNWRQSLSP